MSRAEWWRLEAVEPVRVAERHVVRGVRDGANDRVGFRRHDTRPNVHPAADEFPCVGIGDSKPSAVEGAQGCGGALAVEADTVQRCESTIVCRHRWSVRSAKRASSSGLRRALLFRA